MTSRTPGFRQARAQARVLRVSAEQVERQLWMSVWLVGGLMSATLLTIVTSLTL